MSTPEKPNGEICFNPLWKTLIDKDMTRGDLCRAAHISRATVTKMGKNRPVAMSVITRICRTLDVSVEQVMEYRRKE